MTANRGGNAVVSKKKKELTDADPQKDQLSLSLCI